MKTILGQFWYRLKLAFKIISSPKSRWIFLTVREDGFKALLAENGEEVDIDITYHRMQEYNMWHVLQIAGANKDEIDMMLLKAEFEAKAQEYSDKRKTTPPPP